MLPKVTDAELRSQLDVEIQSLNNDIAAKSSELQALTEQLSSLSDYANFPLDAYQQIQELFVLVGNLRELELAGGETKRLVEHIRQHGEIRS